MFLLNIFIMGAPKGNQFWKKRSKHGRESMFSNPELLQEAAFEYFEWCESTPWTKSELIKIGEMSGSIVDVPTHRPFTLSGLCVYLGVSEQYWGNFRRQRNEVYAETIEYIETIIRTQQWTGAATGSFNSSIIARTLGLTEKQDITTGGEKVNSVPTVVVLNKHCDVMEQIEALGKE